MGENVIKIENGKEVVYDRDWLGDQKIGTLREKWDGTKEIEPTVENEIEKLLGGGHEAKVGKPDIFGNRNAEIDGSKGTLKRARSSSPDDIYQELSEDKRKEASSPSAGSGGGSPSGGSGSSGGSSSPSYYTESNELGPIAKALTELIGVSVGMFALYFMVMKGAPFIFKEYNNQGLEQKIVSSEAPKIKNRMRYIDMGSNKEYRYYSHPLIVHYTNKDGKNLTYLDDEVAKSTGKTHEGRYAYILNCRSHTEQIKSRTGEIVQLDCFVRYPEYVVEVEKRD